jgi:hypothetical protein
MLADPRRIIAIRSRLHLGQTVCLRQAVGRSCLHVTQRGHQFPTWELRGRPRTVLGIDQTNGATLRRDYATFTTRRSARSRPEFPVRFAVVRLERSLYQCASSHTWHGSSSCAQRTVQPRGAPISVSPRLTLQRGSHVGIYPPTSTAALNRARPRAHDRV